ncbi:MAG TPA: AMP-binding protein [Mycobacteriales bacterium]|nr:AMP-binding protein [Mycobacteriales bacterium]
MTGGYPPPWQVPATYNLAADVLAGRDPAQVAMVWADHRGEVRTVGWAELAALTGRAAHLLRRLGVGRGDRVAVVLPPLPETAAITLGVLLAGGVVVVMSPLWRQDAFAYRIGDCAPAVVVTDPAAAPRIRAAAAGTRTTVVELTGDLLTGLPDTFDPVPTSADEPAQIYYTSGTSGPAKGIVHAHRVLLGHNEFEVCHDLRPGEVYHGTGDWAWSLTKVFGPWRLGAIQFVYHGAPRFDPVALFTAMAAHGVTNTLLNPTAIRRLRDTCPDAGARIPLRLRVACSSSEPLAADLIDWFRGQFGVTLLDYYGCTESFPLVSNRPGVPVKPGSMGTPTPGWQVAVLGPDERPVPAGTPGEVCLRARTNPQYPLGYWNRPQASAATFGGEWWHTRDLARVDEDGYFWYLGRDDDVIISAGYRIGPYEVEAALDSHPAVSASAVVGAPDRERGHVVHAFVVPAPGASPGPTLVADLQDHVRRTYALFAYPRQVEFVTELPRSVTNKIQRAELRRRLAAPAPSTASPGERHD